MKDEEIIGLYWERNQQAIPETDMKYGKLLKHIAYQILYNQQDSEECVNDTYLNTWNCIPPQHPIYFQAFLGAITRNLSLDRYKQQHAKKRVPTEMTMLLSELETALPTGQDVQKEIEDREIAVHISSFLRALEPEKRAVFIRRYWYCDDIRNIAQDFGYSESKVKASLFRMREKLKLYLEKEGIWI